MFVRYFLELPLAAGRVEQALLDPPAEWLSAMAGNAQGGGRTQLAISARYRPPLGAVGRAVDRVLLHRVAEATVKDFLDRVGAAIMAEVTSPAAHA
jgi:hypothetical protein